MQDFRARRAALMLGSALLALTAGPVMAQDIRITLDEIVVTAQKRAESIFEVPLTITAYDQQFLDTVGIDALDDLSEFVPGVLIQLQSPNNPGFVVRGITSDDGDFQAAPRVSIYLNGVDVSRSRSSAFEIYDLERVEVVKGPQSTLFGTAASIGAVSVITAKPQKEIEGSAWAAFGSDEYLKLGGYVTGGTDFIQARLAAQLRQRDGFVENIAGDTGSQSAGGPQQDDLNGIDTIALRPSIRLTPTEDLTFDLVINYEQNEPPGTAFKSGVIAPTGGDTSPFTFAELAGPFDNYLGTPFYPQVVAALGDDELGLERTVFDVNAQVEYRVDDNWTVTGIFGHREFDSLEIFDADGSQVPLLEANEDSEGDQQSIELRASYEGERLSAFFGGSYFQEDGFQRSAFIIDETLFASCIAVGAGGIGISPFCVNPDGSFNRLVLLPPSGPGLPPTPAILPADQGFPILSINEFTNFGDHSVFSLFADATYELFDGFEVTAGARYVAEDRNSAIATVFPDSVLNPGQPILVGFSSTGGQKVTAEGEYDDILLRFNARWEASEDVSVYGTISEGRRTPVVRLTQTSVGLPNPVEFLPAEEIWNYEIGAKAILLDGRLRLDGAVYYQDYENFQVSVVLPGSGIVTNQTTGKASNIGFEGAFEAALTPEFSLYGTLAYTEAEIDDDPENGVFAGNTFRLTPQWSTSLAADYRRVLWNDGEGFVTLSYTWRDSVFFEEENQPRAGVPIEDEAAGIVDLRLGVATLDGRWQITGFVDNLFDEEFLIDGGNTGGGFGAPTLIRGEERFWGVELRTAF